MKSQSYFNLKDLIVEDFVNYKVPAMFIGTCACDWKCMKEAKLPIEICQNCTLASRPAVTVPTSQLIRMYLDNPITSAVVFGGLEPMLQFDEILDFIKQLREVDLSDIVIYTGYYKNEVQDKIEILKQFPNIVIKFGRYRKDKPPRYDEILGVKLASDNQYARRIS